jgi:hypothetical protein
MDDEPQGFRYTPAKDSKDATPHTASAITQRIGEPRLFERSPAGASGLSRPLLTEPISQHNRSQHLGTSPPEFHFGSYTSASCRFACLRPQSVWRWVDSGDSTSNPCRMIKTGSQFEFEIEDGWTEFREGNRFVFQAPPSPAGFQELIVQGSLVAGEGTEEQRQHLVSVLLGNALTAIRKTLAQESTVILRPLGPDESFQNPSAWIVVAQGAFDQRLFCSAVFRGQMGVLFATFESSIPSSVSVFDAFARSVRLATQDADTQA